MQVHARMSKPGVLTSLGRLFAKNQGQCIMKKRPASEGPIKGDVK
jgi:hypothetical protein